MESLFNSDIVNYSTLDMARTATSGSLGSSTAAQNVRADEVPAAFGGRKGDLSGGVAFDSSKVQPLTSYGIGARVDSVG